MNFPPWVPASAREHILQILESSDSERRRDLKNRLKSLMNDSRIEHVFQILKSILTTEEQFFQFICAAAMVKVDYRSFRERMETAKKLAPQIAKHARKLAELLKDARNNGWFSEELSSTLLLLEITDSANPKWRTDRSIVTAMPEVLAKSSTQPAKVAASGILPTDLRGREVGIDKEEIAREKLRAAWCSAPTLPELLSNLARVAEDYQSLAIGPIAIAIRSQKTKHPATEYVRAFGTILRDLYHFELKAPLFAAIAETAEVVLGEDDGKGISAGAVRLALTKIPAAKL